MAGPSAHWPAPTGALREFLMMLGPDDDIARFEYLKKSARNFGSVLIGIETKAAQNFGQLFGRMNAAGFTYRDITQGEPLAEFLI
jgi:threonine dehydratase